MSSSRPPNQNPTHPGQVGHNNMGPQRDFNPRMPQGYPTSNMGSHHPGSATGSHHHGASMGSGYPGSSMGLSYTGPATGCGRPGSAMSSQNPTSSMGRGHPTANIGYSNTGPPMGSRHPGTTMGSSHHGPPMPSSHAISYVHSGHAGSSMPYSYPASMPPGFAGPSTLPTYTGPNMPSSYTGAPGPSGYPRPTMPPGYSGSSMPSSHRNAPIRPGYAGLSMPTNYVNAQTNDGFIQVYDARGPVQYNYVNSMTNNAAARPSDYRLIPTDPQDNSVPFHFNGLPMIAGGVHMPSLDSMIPYPSAELDANNTAFIADEVKKQGVYMKTVDLHQFPYGAPSRCAHVINVEDYLTRLKAQALRNIKTGDFIFRSGIQAYDAVVTALYMYGKLGDGKNYQAMQYFLDSSKSFQFIRREKNDATWDMYIIRVDHVVSCGFFKGGVTPALATHVALATSWQIGERNYFEPLHCTDQTGKLNSANGQLVKYTGNLWATAVMKHELWKVDNDSAKITWGETFMQGIDKDATGTFLKKVKTNFNKGYIVQRGMYFDFQGDFCGRDCLDENKKKKQFVGRRGAGTYVRLSSGKGKGKLTWVPAVDAEGQEGEEHGEGSTMLEGDETTFMGGDTTIDEEETPAKKRKIEETEDVDTVQEAVYHAQEPGYNAQERVYDTQQPVNTNTLPESIYTAPQPGYTGQESVYTARQPGYTGQQLDYTGQESVYNAQEPGYDAQERVSNA